MGVENFWSRALAFCNRPGKLADIGSSRRSSRFRGFWDKSAVNENSRLEPAFGNRISIWQGGHVMARRLATQITALGVFGLLLSGCVARDQYEAIKMERNALAEQLGTAQASSAADRAAADAWKSQQERLITAGDDKDKMVATVSKENAELSSRLRELQGVYERSLNDKGQIIMGNPLAPEVNRDIAALADQTGGIMTFDARTGTVKL